MKKDASRGQRFENDYQAKFSDLYSNVIPKHNINSSILPTVPMQAIERCCALTGQAETQKLWLGGQGKFELSRFISQPSRSHMRYVT